MSEVVDSLLDLQLALHPILNSNNVEDIKRALLELHEAIFIMANHPALATLPAGANQAALTNSTGGTYDGTLAAISGSGDDANINNNFTDIHTLLDEIRTALVSSEIMKGAA